MCMSGCITAPHQPANANCSSSLWLWKCQRETNQQKEQCEPLSTRLDGFSSHKSDQSFPPNTLVLSFCQQSHSLVNSLFWEVKLASVHLSATRGCRSQFDPYFYSCCRPTPGGAVLTYVLFHSVGHEKQIRRFLLFHLQEWNSISVSTPVQCFRRWMSKGSWKTNERVI